VSASQVWNLIKDGTGCGTSRVINKSSEAYFSVMACPQHRMGWDSSHPQTRSIVTSMPQITQASFGFFTVRFFLTTFFATFLVVLLFKDFFTGMMLLLCCWLLF
jgi:hypothetical protein